MSTDEKHETIYGRSLHFKRYAIGDRVSWTGRDDKGVQGTVTEITNYIMAIRWDGDDDEFFYIDTSFLKNVSKSRA